MAGGSYDHLVNVTLFGKEKSGKTQLIHALSGKYMPDYMPTIAADIQSLVIENIKYQIFDTGGAQQYRSIGHRFFQRADIVVFAVDPLDTDASIAEWKNYKDVIPKNAKVIVAVTKGDTEAAVALSNETLEEKLKEADIKCNEFFRCSAKEFNIAEFKTALQNQANILTAPTILSPSVSAVAPTVDIASIKQKLELLPGNDKRYDKPSEASARFENYVIDFRTAALKELGKLEELESKGKLSKKHNKQLTLLSEATTTVSSLHESVSSQAQVTDKKDIKISDIKQCNKLASRFKGSKIAGILLGLAGLAITIAGITVSAMAGAGFFPSMTLAAPIGAGGLGIVAAGVATLTVAGTHLFFGRHTDLSTSMQGVAGEAKKVEKQFRV